MSALTREHHHYDLLKTNEVFDPQAELDRLSLCTPIDEGPRESDDSSHPEVVRYGSLIDLREQWKRLDCAEFALQLTVVLLLRKNFNGHLAGLIRRQHPALRLMIASPTGRLPGLTTIGDLALHSASLGWHLISFHRDISEAVAGALEPMAWQERCVLFWPAGAELGESSEKERESASWERRWM